MLCRIKPCRDVLYRFTACCVVPYYVVSCRVVSCRVVCCVVSCHVVLYRVVCCVVLCRVFDRVFTLTIIKMRRNFDRVFAVL